MNMSTNISEASANLMAIITQQVSVVTIALFISTDSRIPMAQAIPEDIQLDSAILVQSSTIPVGSAILDVILVHSDILVQSGIPEAYVVTPPKSPHFTPAAPTVLTPTAPIPTSVSEETIVSPTWLEDPLRYMVVMTPPSCVPAETLITPEVEPVFIHVS
jgi:hypothetical protein